MGIEVSKKKCHKATAKGSESQEIADQIIKLEINELANHKTMDEGSSYNNIGHKLKPRRYIFIFCKTCDYLVYYYQFLLFDGAKFLNKITQK